MRTIKDESELPPPEGTTRMLQEFIRSLSAPTVLQDCRSGECFSRADQQNWKHPAYTRSASMGVTGQLDWPEVEPTTAKFDNAIYPYAEKQAA